jgi:putative endonuclease
MSWEVYIIQTQSGKLYTGITINLDRRFIEHQQRKKGARFFRFSEPGQIVFRESHPNRSEATKREIEIKKMTRKEKLLLIENGAFVESS